jgi:hypothetical protein
MKFLFIWLTAFALSAFTLVPGLMFGLFGVIGWMFITAFFLTMALLAHLVVWRIDQDEAKVEAVLTEKQKREQVAWDEIVRRLNAKPSSNA